MSRRGPFSDSDSDTATIVRPSPGWRRQQTPRVEAASTPATRPAEFDVAPGFQPKAGGFTEGALSLLMIASKLRTIVFHDAIGDLQERLAGEIRDFQNRALQQGFSEHHVRIASYFVCSFIDETVLNTPWGGQSNWGHDSLLVRFHKEALGGEEFFQTLDRLLQRPAQNLDLLELAYLCLSLGFEGKYRYVKDGLRELEKLRTEVYLVIQRIRGEPESGLSVTWQGIRDLRSPLTRYVPLWVLAVVAALLLLALYLAFSYTLSSASNRVYAQWVAIANEEAKIIPEQQTASARIAFPQNAPSVVVQDKASPTADRTQTLRELFANEIAQKMIEVLDGPILRITNAFPSGSDRVQNNRVPVLTKLAQELNKGPGRIEVIGHTDNKPIFSARFPSNWDLSNARAKTVAGLLNASGALGERITSKGRAENEPIAPNDTEENRAMNRRVDIHIR